jgi:hypothetical protein
MGLTVSAEEIIRDRKILKRESFLNLSWNSYLTSKVLILFTLSAVQTLCFVLIGNTILEINGMNLSFWLVLFSVSCFANVLGLNISASFSSAVTVYILIPLILIPQMILSGLLFSFDKLNSVVGSKGEVPIIADVMVSRWAYEAMAVHQFKENAFQRPYYTLEQEERQADFKAAYLAPQLESKLQLVSNHLNTPNDSLKTAVRASLTTLRNELRKAPFRLHADTTNWEALLHEETVTLQVIEQLRAYLKKSSQHYVSLFNKSVENREKLVYYLENQPDIQYDLNEYKDRYHNESLSDLVRNVNSPHRIIEDQGRLLQTVDPVFNDPTTETAFFNYRTHFFAPRKHLGGVLIDTYYFNIAVIWVMTILLYCCLYYGLFSGIVTKLSSLKIAESSK